MEITDKNSFVRKMSKRYILQSLGIVSSLVLMGCVLKSFRLCDYNILTPMAVSFGYTLFLEVACAMLWKYMAIYHNESLPAYFTAVSGFRMLLAISTLVVCWLIVGQNQMLVYCLIFACFYFPMLLHHSVFFAHISLTEESKCQYK